MSDPIHYDPSIPVWVVPSDDDDLAPLPALLVKETEHEIVVHEYDRPKRQFEAATVERRTKAYAHFEECRVAMLQSRAEILNTAKVAAQNQASIYNHILSMNPVLFPTEQADAFLSKQVQGQEEAQASQEVKPAIKRPVRRVVK
jgi:hypothetical protein